MRVYDQIAAVVKSGGKTRRAAKMQSLKIWHPDILEFIQCKQKEEKKARTLIAAKDAHYGATPLGWCCHGSLHGNRTHDHAGRRCQRLAAPVPQGRTHV